MTADSDHNELTRRRVLRDAGAGVLSIGAIGTLVACGDGDEDAGTPDERSDGGYGVPRDEDPPAPEEAPAGDAIAAIDDIPVGGAISATASGGAEIILARPSEAEVVGFSAVCTHQGCTVAPAEDEIRCPCHGSVYEMLTGENVSGPAPSPLEPFDVRVAGDSVIES